MQNILYPYQKQVIRTEKVTTGYPNQKTRKIVSENLSLDIRNGEMVTLLGPNGCGKSTLMRTIGGLQKRLSGCVYINDSDTQQMSAKDRARHLSLVLTERVESANLTINDIVSIGRYPYVGHMGKLSESDWLIVNRSLKVCSLEGWGERLFSELSDGEKQRVMIARALAQDTPFMLLDEPTAHLDLPNRIEMMRMLNELAKRTGKAILVSTHELDLAMQWADTIWLMDKMGNVFTGIPEDIVLSGKIADIFCNRNFYFDMKSGQFKMNRTHTLPISVQGEGINREWTIRALERVGFDISPPGEGIYLVGVLPHKWTLSLNGTILNNYDSIGGLLKALQTEEYWKNIYD